MSLEIGIQIALVVATLSLVVITALNMHKTNKHTEEQLALTRKEIESRLRAELEVASHKSNLEQDGNKFLGKVTILVRNHGVVSARNIHVHFKDPTSSLDLAQLIRDEKEIKKSYFPIKGSIPRGLYAEVSHTTPLDESKVYQVAVWVTYDYADVKGMEFIQIIEVNSQVHSEVTLYEKKDIENEKESQRNRGEL